MTNFDTTKFDFWDRVFKILEGLSERERKAVDSASKREKSDLDFLLEKQKELMDFYREHRKWYEKANLNEKLFVFAYAVIAECGEFIDGLNWKPWKNEKELDFNYLKEELIDVLHFWLTLCLLLGMDADEIKRRYLEKNKENFRRQREVEGYKVSETEDDGYAD